MVKPIDEIVREQITEDILRDEFFEHNQIPTANELEARVDAFLEEHPDLTIPLTSKEDIRVEELEESSASKFSNTLVSLHKDLRSAYTALFSLTQSSMEDFDRYSAEIKLLNNRLTDLESRVNGLLLVARDTEGFIAFVEDNFVDFEKVDQGNTTAEIDADNHIVKLPDSASTSFLTKINLNTVREQDVRFSVLTKKFLSSTLLAPGTQLRYAFWDQQSFWQHRLTLTSQAEPVTTELVVKLGDVAIEVSKINFSLFASGASSPVLFNVQYSLDDYNYYPLPIESFIQSADEVAFWSFPSTEMKFVKFIMTKSGPDDDVDGLFVYEFGAKNISFFKQTYDPAMEAIFQSRPLVATDSAGDVVFFNKVALETCEKVPENTSLDFQISIDGGTGFFDIAPINREQPLAATSIDLGGITESNNSGVFLDIGNTVVPQLSFVNAEDRAIRTKSDGVTPIIAAGDPVVESTLQVYRNIGNNAQDVQVREIASGWRFEDPYYITTIVVMNPDGITVDLGDFEAEVDGALTKGNTLIGEGVHHFVTHKSNWQPIDLTAVSSMLNVDDLKALDSLYPFNHKLIVEGVNYPANYSGDRIYTGMDIYAEFLMDRVSPFDLRNNVGDNDYSKFAIDSDSTGDKFLLMKINNEIGDSTNERFLVNYNISDAEFAEIILRARLRTTNPGLTPMFSKYRLRLSI